MRIYIDVDDCINNMKEYFIRKAILFGYIPNYREITHWDLKKFFYDVDEKTAIQYIDNIFLSRDFWKTIPLKDGVIDIIRELNHQHTIYFATAPWWNDVKCMEEKVKYIKINFPFIDPHQIIFISKKWLLKGDLIIDDKPETIEKFDGMTIIMNQPYNQTVYADYRVEDWNEILFIINNIQKNVKELQ